MATKANFTAYHNYVTDSLHQWDLNQVLTVQGLNLAVVPEVHFSNKNMDRAIVRQATMENHVVTVNIPNSLLQDPLRIYAHIGIYEGSTFKVVEVVEIPVIPRTRPCDYQIEDNDGEVYSFQALENKMSNMATRSQLANIVANISSDGELVDVRYGADGVLYPSAGEAVRQQVGTIASIMNDAVIKKCSETAFTVTDGLLTKDGAVSTFTDATGYCYASLQVVEGEYYIAQGYYGYKHPDVLVLDAVGDVIQYYNENTSSMKRNYLGDHIYRMPANAHTLIVNGATTVVPPAIHKIDSFELQVNVWKGLKWACVGDSLTEANDRTTKNYHDYIAEKTGISVVNMGDSGSGYKREYDSNNAFYQRIMSVPLDTDVVTIFGSGNDSAFSGSLGDPTDTGTDTLCGCINTTIDNLLTRLPTVQLGIVTPTPWESNPPSDPGNFFSKYSAAIVEICKLRGIPCLDLFHCSGLRPWTVEGRAACYSKDDGNGVHPDETGHKIIAARFKSFLETLIL